MAKSVEWLSLARIGRQRMLVLWTSRQVCAQGGTRPLVRAVAIIGLPATLAAIVHQAGDPTLLYGRWTPRDEGAWSFGPFVNRNPLCDLGADGGSIRPQCSTTDRPTPV